MDPNNPNFFLNLQDPDSSQYHSNTHYENSEGFMYNNQVSIPKNTQTSTKISKAAKWETREDIKEKFWTRVREYYEETRAENPEGLRIRNENQMKSRYARLNEAANKWIVAYREAYRQKRSGMSTKDVEKEAHAIFEMGGSKFNDLIVFNEVMCKHPKWDLQLGSNTTRSRPHIEVDDEESGGSIKRSKTSEEGGYSTETNQESPNPSASKVQRPIGGDAAKEKEKASQSSLASDYSEQFRSLNITRSSEVEVMSKKLDFEKENTHYKTLHILLAKEHLSPGEEALKQRLIQQLNQQLDRIIDDIVINSANLFINDQPPGARRKYRDRQREIGEARLMEDYFTDNPTYDADMFRRRFRMQRSLFLRIVDAVTANDEYFQQRPDGAGRQGLSPLQKCTAAMRVLAYGESADAVDEYLRWSHLMFRKPNRTDLARLLYIGDQCGFPDMIGSIDYMHWEWKNCPSGWAGQCAGRSGKPTIILESVASYDLWIWHAFFGTPGSLNDINVLHRSPIFDDVLIGQSPKVSYIVNGHEYDKTYYLTDGIYPSWAAFVKSITSPQIQKHKLFAQVQEACRKDVERAFGVLQARFAFIRRPCLVWDRHLMGQIMIACIIMHNMIVEDE
ncbi:LOW QUALITY PROTEIN: hypothetical protein OSB04_020033 [Centaurea solstitialis]|uniref:No apical meristem-associated C-terminal domain-containing protein n=1 Tax=Centaurea solstitialis TaxID=347529 RepID=A0AA38WCW8_9ASTR|nr:LOW QUALITY PROTEIN: hypothetical protein OSB04_020033 [Centaurea solstitialis]